MHIIRNTTNLFSTINNFQIHFTFHDKDSTHDTRNFNFTLSFSLSEKNKRIKDKKMSINKDDNMHKSETLKSAGNSLVECQNLISRTLFSKSKSNCT